MLRVIKFLLPWNRTSFSSLTCLVPCRRRFPAIMVMTMRDRNSAMRPTAHIYVLHRESGLIAPLDGPISAKTFSAPNGPRIAARRLSMCPFLP